jgi:hypothetical protein
MVIFDFIVQNLFPVEFIMPLTAIAGFVAQSIACYAGAEPRKAAETVAETVASCLSGPRRLPLLNISPLDVL